MLDGGGVAAVRCKEISLRRMTAVAGPVAESEVGETKFADETTVDLPESTVLSSCGRSGNGESDEGEGFDRCQDDHCPTGGSGPAATHDQPSSQG